MPDDEIPIRPASTKLSDLVNYIRLGLNVEEPLEEFDFVDQTETETEDGEKFETVRYMDQKGFVYTIVVTVDPPSESHN